MTTSTKNSIFKQIVTWLQRLFSPKKSKYQPQKLLLELNSSLTRLVLVERDTPRAIRTWRSVPKEGDYDLLITCDHLFKVPGEPPIEKANPKATHRLTITQISRIPGPKGKRKITPIWSADFIWVSSSTGTADMNRYAIVITDALAKQTLGTVDTEISWAWEATAYTKQYVGNTVLYPLIGHSVEDNATPAEGSLDEPHTGSLKVSLTPLYDYAAMKAAQANFKAAITQQALDRTTKESSQSSVSQSKTA